MKPVTASQSMIVRKVRNVRRDLPPAAILEATGRTVHCHDDVVAAMPKGERRGNSIVFFEPRAMRDDRPFNDDELSQEYAHVALIPVDPYSLAAFNRDDPAFAGECPHATHWKDAEGRWCQMSFKDTEHGSEVHVAHHKGEWMPVWRFAGIVAHTP